MSLESPFGFLRSRVKVELPSLGTLHVHLHLVAAATAGAVRSSPSFHTTVGSRMDGGNTFADADHLLEPALEPETVGADLGAMAVREKVAVVKTP